MKALTKIVFRDEVSLMVICNQKSFDGICEVTKNFIIIPDTNKGVEDDVLIPLANIASLSFQQIIEGSLEELAD